ncbi:MAG: two-component system LytT family response regulator [Granulosicoccus sp.]|jgi:two-component system LytT family response regulator
MIKTFLIDDEPESIQTVSSLIEVSCPNVAIEGKFTDPFEGVQAILDNKPDVILLDIEMPSMTGLELLRRLPSIEFEVIFITAYNDYAVHAFKLSAIDYLLKPVDPDELVIALEKAEQSIARKRIVNQFEILEGLLNKN